MLSDAGEGVASLIEVRQLIREGDLSPEEAVDAFLDRIEERDDEINAYTDVYDDEALAAGRNAEEDGNRPLHGVPIALKDLGMQRKGDTITSGSQIMASAGKEAEKTAAAVKRLEEAGVIVLGRTNTPEFGYGFITDNNLYGPTASPINTDYNAGGSSGGAAAAVAAGMAPAALGSDMAGSIRIPAAACGVFGLKPSEGVIPDDARPNAFSADAPLQVTYGPITRTVEDAAVLMDVMAGQHPRDPASVPADIDFTGSVDWDVDDLRIAYTPDFGLFDVEEGVDTVASEAARILGDAGGTVDDVSIDHGLSFEEYDEAVQTTIGQMAGHSTEVIRQAQGFDVTEYTDHLSNAVLQSLQWGEEASDADTAAVDLARTAFFDAIQDVFGEYDVIVSPTLATPGLKIDSERYGAYDETLTLPFNWTGHPAASVPAGLTNEETPVGLQIVAPLYDDDIVIAVSAAIERNQPWEHLYGEN